jgi:membrane protease YdiL (CAAX protease family)
VERQNRPTGPFIVWLCLSVFFASAARQYFRPYGLPLRAEVALYACLVLQLFLAVVPAAYARTAPVARRFWGLLILLLWVAAYLITAAGTGDFRVSSLARLFAVCGPPVLVYAAAPIARLDRLHWQDVVAWTWLTLAVVLREFNGIWNVPSNLDFMARLLMIGVAAWCWVFLRPTPGLGYEFRLSGRVVGAAALAFFGFAALALPGGLATGFAVWNPHWRGLLSLSETFLEILVFIAWLEELFFRGFLQSMLERTWNSPRAGHLAASVAFGLSHILLGQAPNWRYVVLASFAGWFYGWAFHKGGNLVAPALTHALVDTVWRTWFRAPG